MLGVARQSKGSWAPSLGLEHEECLVLALEQVEEQHPFGLISNGGGKTLTHDYMPACGLVLQFVVLIYFLLDIRGKVFVKLLALLLVTVVADADGGLLQVLGHVREPHSVLWHWLFLHLLLLRIIVIGHFELIFCYN